MQARLVPLAPPRPRGRDCLRIPARPITATSTVQNSSGRDHLQKLATDMRRARHHRVHMLDRYRVLWFTVPGSLARSRSKAATANSNRTSETGPDHHRKPPKFSAPTWERWFHLYTLREVGATISTPAATATHTTHTAQHGTRVRGMEEEEWRKAWNGRVARNGA